MLFQDAKFPSLPSSSLIRLYFVALYCLGNVAHNLEYSFHADSISPVRIFRR